MATNSFQSLHRASLLRRLSPAATPPSSASSSSHSLFLKPTSTAVTTVAAASSFPQPAQSLPSSSPAAPTSLDLLLRHLAAQNFRAADEETRRLLLVLAGEPATKRGYVFFSEVQFVPEADLRTIDALWRDHSGGRFGYSVQKKILDKSHGDFTRFFIAVGWMKRLDADQVVQYNYRAFPAEFTWELRDDTPAGHLPLTNVLRGTQLLSSILRHPAFDETIEEGDDDAGKGNEDGGGSKSNSKPLMGQRPTLKADYSF